MGPFAFGNAGLIGWLAALIVPWIVYRSARRALITYELPTYFLLVRSAALQSPLVRFRALLLYALRTLALLALVLAFMKPEISAPLGRRGDVGPQQERSQGRLVVVVLDTSLSMRYVRDGASSFQRASSAVARLLRELGPADRVNLILAGRYPRLLFDQPTTDLGSVIGRLEHIEPSDERSDMDAALAIASDQLTRYGDKSRDLAIASDFQSTNWHGVSLDRLPADVHPILIRSDSATRDSIALTGLTALPAAPKAGEQTTVLARVWNGTPSVKRITVTLSISPERGSDSRDPEGAARVDTVGQVDSAAGMESMNAASVKRVAEVEASGFSEATASFSIALARGRGLAEARIAGARPSFDLTPPTSGSRFLVLDVGARLAVLLITDEPMRGGNGAYYLARALDPDPIPTGAGSLREHASEEGDGDIRVRVQRGSRLKAEDLAQSSVAIVDDAPSLSANEIEILARFVREGGSLIMMSAADAAAKQVAELNHLAPSGDDAPFLPLRQHDLKRSGSQEVSIGAINFDSPLLRLFRDPRSADFKTMHFQRIYDVKKSVAKQPGSVDGSEPLLTFDDGIVAAARGSYGSGALLLCNFSVAPVESDLARNPLFPPLMHEFVRGMSALSVSAAFAQPGEPVSVRLALDAKNAQDASRNGVPGDLHGVGPDGRAEEIHVLADPLRVFWNPVQGVGFHTVWDESGPIATIAVNGDSREYDLRAIAPMALFGANGSSGNKLSRRETGLLGKGYTTVDADRPNAIASIDQLVRGRPLWPLCVITAILLLALEQFVSLRISRRNAPPTPRFQGE